MPELPEVESVRQGLIHLVQGKVIQDIVIDWDRIIVTEQPLSDWIEHLKGQQINTVERRAKFLIFRFDDWALISHLRMEGKYHFYPADEVPATKDKHTHVRFLFTDGSQLHYHDVRKFGRMELVAPEAVQVYFLARKLGPEPNAEQFHLSTFKTQLSQLKKPIKPLLLDQRVVAGLGNIYADEVLFEAKIHPTRPANSLTDQEVAQLYDAILNIMAAAIQAGGSSVRTYLNSLGEAGTYQEQLKVYGRPEEPCPRCGQLISKIQFAGRGTHFCSHCQPVAYVEKA